MNVQGAGGGLGSGGTSSSIKKVKDLQKEWDDLKGKKVNNPSVPSYNDITYKGSTINTLTSYLYGEGLRNMGYNVDTPEEYNVYIYNNKYYNGKSSARAAVDADIKKAYDGAKAKVASLIKKCNTLRDDCTNSQQALKSDKENVEAFNKTIVEIKEALKEPIYDDINLVFHCKPDSLISNNINAMSNKDTYCQEIDLSGVNSLIGQLFNIISKIDKKLGELGKQLNSYGEKKPYSNVNGTVIS